MSQIHPALSAHSHVQKWGDASSLARKNIEDRVAAHNQYLARRGNEKHVPSLLTVLVERLTDFNASLESIPTTILETYIWTWHTMPYLSLYRSLLHLSTSNTYGLWGRSEGANCSLFEDSKIDEWILRNEKWLRNRDHTNWRHGMIRLNDAAVVFPNSILTDSARLITRLDDLPGYKMLSEGRERQLRIQPSNNAFGRAFEVLSNGLLKSLDWNNILVAGGIALATLVTVGNFQDIQGLQTRWAPSDIDIYLYGLSPEDANRKIIHIFDVFRSNLPPHIRTLALRNSKTITFYAEYPWRRIQIVLKLGKNPRDILLNFDLDICAMGWDGQELWMLPRAARAIETGFNTFTMNLVHGHYLSDRRASQPHRIFKYANKGYGLRMLPIYMSSLLEAHSEDDALSFDVPFLSEQARIWTKNKYLSAVTEGASRFFRTDLYEPGSRSSSALSSFTTLMRHVGLWEMGQFHEDISIDQNDWASTSYEDTHESIPRLQYNWNESFNQGRFRSHIIQSNIDDIDDWVRSDLEGRLELHGVTSGDELNAAARLVLASHAKDLLDPINDIRIPIILPGDFALYANQLVKQVQNSTNLPETNLLEPAINASIDVFTTPDSREGLFVWRIGVHIMWQQLDRRIDELFEVLYAFRRANQHLNEDLQLERFTRALSQRNDSAAVVEHEFEAFAKWISGRD